MITYLENKPIRKKILTEAKNWPTVSILVPCWNEEETVLKTVFSLLKLDYPRDKLSMTIIDDGSTDRTWDVLQRLKNHKQIRLLRKENGGKASALNFALEFVRSEFVGSLDADSFVHPKALKRIIVQFRDVEMMAVTPSIKVFEPKTVIELIQKVEYAWGILFRNILSHLNALYVTPGPFSIFRRELFDKIGGFREAHQTEDMEMAFRMQTNGLKIGNAPDAFVYTVVPKSIGALYRQRLRWTYGFLKNAIDHKHLFFNPKYGNLGVAVLPAASLSIFSSLYLVSSAVWSWITKIFDKASEIRTVGWNFDWNIKFDWFFFSTDIAVFLGIVGFIGTLCLIFLSRRMAEEKSRLGIEIIYFLSLYIFLTPLWVTRALYNVVFSRSIAWR